MKVNTKCCKLIPFLFLAPIALSPGKANTPLVNEINALSGGQVSRDTVFNFDTQKPGSLHAGWTEVLGSWIVKKDGNNQVLAQVAVNRGMDFNVVVFDEAILKDLQLSADIRAIAGKEDQGGGLVWRYADSNNYYIVRFNPLEDNLRLYKVLNGRRIQLVSVTVTIPKGSWFNIRVIMKGAEITCYFNGKELIRTSDDTFVNAGKTGFWTKADAVSDFDNFNMKGK